MTEITIKTEYIRLQDLLKFASLVSTGGEAKLAIASEDASVNEEICTQRGKKIRPGDVVRFRGQEITVRYADR